MIIQLLLIAIVLNCFTFACMAMCKHFFRYREFELWGQITFSVRWITFRLQSSASSECAPSCVAKRSMRGFRHNAFLAFVVVWLFSILLLFKFSKYDRKISFKIRISCIPHSSNLKNHCCTVWKIFYPKLLLHNLCIVFFQPCL